LDNGDINSTGLDEIEMLGRELAKNEKPSQKFFHHQNGKTQSNKFETAK